MHILTASSAWRTFARRRPLLMSAAVLAWSTRYAVSLALVHTTGAELYGVLTAVIAVCAAVGNLVVVRSSRTNAVVIAALLVVWGLVALAGLGGAIAHVVGPVAGHGPLDPRPRPVLAPLVFTVLGFVGALALVLARRMANHTAH